MAQTKAQIQQELDRINTQLSEYSPSEVRVLRCYKCIATIDTMNGMCTYQCPDDMTPLGAREYICETVEFLERVLFAEVVKPKVGVGIDLK